MGICNLRDVDTTARDPVTWSRSHVHVS